LPSWRTLSLDVRTCPACRRRPTAVDEGRVAALYAETLPAIVRAYKYDGRPSLGRPLASLIGEAAADLLADSDCVVPVPLHPWKRVRRGFNQAAVIARHLGPPVVHALWRVRLMRPQVGLSAADRRRTVRDAFAPSRTIGSRALDLCVRHRVVTLVDDVRTTGATLHECAVVLKRMGAREVRSVTLAQAPVREGEPRP
jgi:ComF family protein